MTFGVFPPAATGGAGGGAIVVATSADLPTPAEDGASYYVTSQRARYDAIGTDWVRATTDPSWAAQTEWYVASTGTADASGADSSHPTTVTEVLARLGTTPVSGRAAGPGHAGVRAGLVDVPRAQDRMVP
jgi:hypothetical protein